MSLRDDIHTKYAMLFPLISDQNHILLSGLKHILGYKDMRSVLTWCDQNGVCIIHQGNQKWVNKYEFLLSFYKPFIGHLRARHTNWKTIAVHFMEGNLEALLTSVFGEPVTPHAKKQRKVQTDFLTSLKNL